MKAKKGLAESALALLIIALITIGFLGIFVYDYSQRQTCVQKVELCKMSISFLNTFKKATGHSLVAVTPKLDCPICVPDSSFEIKNKKEEQTLHEIADHLRWCWYKTTGKDNTIGEDFGKFYAISKTIAEKDLNVCIVCSEFKTNIEISNSKLQKYLAETKITNTPGQGKTYAQYLDMNLGIEGIGSNKILPTLKLVDELIQNEDIDFKQVQNTPSKLAEGWWVTTIEKVSAEQKRLILEEVSKAQRTSKSTQNILPQKQFQVISYNWILEFEKRPFNQIFIVPNDEVSELPCDIYHYQKE